MALIVLSGYPSSGKTQRANEIRTFLEGRIADSRSELAFKSVKIINDESIGLSKDAYSTTSKEKAARGALYSAIQRNLGPGQALIVDALNYIKGFRYQIYCIGRELGFRQVTVHVAVAPDICHGWNQGRKETERYTEKAMTELIMRYEEPDAFNRWEAPLVVLPKDDGPGITGYAADELWKAITEGHLRPPNQATVSSTVAQTDQLQLIESTASMIINQVASSIRTDPGLSILTLNVGQERSIDLVMPAVSLRHPPSMVALQGIKRQFVQMHRTAHVSGASLSVDRKTTTISKTQIPSTGTSSFRKAPTQYSMAAARPQGFVESFEKKAVAENFVHYLESCLAAG